MREKINKENGLYRPEFEHDSCGIGCITQIDGEKNHKLVHQALEMLSRLEMVQVYYCKYPMSFYLKLVKS
jgi:glutamate synthase (NADPH/NADH) large chain